MFQKYSTEVLEKIMLNLERGLENSLAVMESNGKKAGYAQNNCYLTLAMIDQIQAELDSRS